MRDGRLQGKVALVVGGGSGMGRAGAAAMAAEGASVVVSDIALDRAEAVAASIADAGGTAVRMHVDVTSPELVQALVAETVGRFGRLDALYHCAADVHFVNTKDTRLTELDDDVWRRIIDVHLTGTFLVLKHVGRQMVAQRSGLDHRLEHRRRTRRLRRSRLVHGGEGRRDVDGALVRRRRRDATACG